MSKNSEKVRQARSSPDFHFLMDALWDLYMRMSHTDGDPAKMNVLEAYQSFKRQSRKGEDCTYVLKVLKLFQKQDYQDIKLKITELFELFQEMEENTSFPFL